MSLVRYPDKARTENLENAFTTGVEARDTGRCFLLVEANKATLHFAANIIAPVSTVRLMPPGAIDLDETPASWERGLCSLSGEPVFVVVSPAGALDVDNGSPRKLVAGDWIIGKVEWVRKPA